MYRGLFVASKSRTCARTYPPSTLLFGLPVSVNSISPTRNCGLPSALNSRLSIVSTSAAISLVNGVVQFAVLSSRMSTFGTPLLAPAG